MRRGLFVAFALAGCADPALATRAPIVGGAPDDAHGAVVAVINWDRASGGGLCTGTLVAPDRVLTAKHCVWHRLDSGTYVATAADRLEVRAGPHAVDDIRATRGVVEVLSTPGDYTVDRIWEGDDVALGCRPRSARRAASRRRRARHGA